MKPGAFTLGPQKRGSVPRQVGLAIGGLAMSAALFYCAPPPPSPEPLCGSAPQLDVVALAGDGALACIEDEQLIGVHRPEPAGERHDR